MRRLFKVSAVTLAVLVMATPAWALNVSQSFKVYLDGIDSGGHVTVVGGQCATFYALLNTTTGLFTGKAVGTVKNCSIFPAVAVCQNFFADPCWCISVVTSLYGVTKIGGVAVYTATGFAKFCPLGDRLWWLINVQ